MKPPKFKHLTMDMDRNIEGQMQTQKSGLHQQLLSIMQLEEEVGATFKGAVPLNLIGSPRKRIVEVIN